MDSKNKIMEISALLGFQHKVDEDGVLTVEKPEYVFTMLEREEGIIEGNIMYKKRIPLSLMADAAKRLAKINFSCAVSGAFLERETGYYGMRHVCSSLEPATNIAFCAYVLLKEAPKHLINR